MLNRRQFVRTATAAATFARIPDALAAKAKKYDLILKGGRVIDPARKLDAIRDVAIADGKIVAIGANISADAAETFDASGKLVVPGLIDIHTHAARSKEGPELCLADGVTGWIDAGSQGADRIRETIAGPKSSPHGPGSDQHRARRHPAGRRHHGPQPRRRRGPRAKPPSATAT